MYCFFRPNHDPFARACIACRVPCVALLTRRVDGSHVRAVCTPYGTVCTRAHTRRPFTDSFTVGAPVCVYDATLVCTVRARARGSVEEGAALGMRPCLPPTCYSGRRAVSVPFLACRPLACTNINLIFYLVESTARRGLYSKPEEGLRLPGR